MVLYCLFRSASLLIEIIFLFNIVLQTIFDRNKDLMQFILLLVKMRFQICVIFEVGTSKLRRRRHRTKIPDFASERKN